METPLSRRILLAWLGFALVLFMLDLLTGSPFWAIWPAWATLMPVAALVGSAMMTSHRLLGAWIGFGLVGCLGLIAIDLFVSKGTPWFFWPVGIWLVVTAVVIGLRVDLIGMVPTSQPASEPDGEDRG